MWSTDDSTHENLLKFTSWWHHLWPHGLCSCFSGCVTNFGNSKLIFASGTKLQVEDSKLFHVISMNWTLIKVTSLISYLTWFYISWAQEVILKKSKPLDNLPVTTPWSLSEQNSTIQIKYLSQWPVACRVCWHQDVVCVTSLMVYVARFPVVWRISLLTNSSSALEQNWRLNQVSYRFSIKPLVR